MSPDTLMSSNRQRRDAWDDYDSIVTLFEVSSVL